MLLEDRMSTRRQRFGLRTETLNLDLGPLCRSCLAPISTCPRPRADPSDPDGDPAGANRRDDARTVPDSSTCQQNWTREPRAAFTKHVTLE